MCDYSLHHVGSRPAKVNDKLVTTELAMARTRGFAAVGEQGAKLVIHDAPPKVAVCLMPGTELAFDDFVQHDRAFSFLGKVRLQQKLARFRQIDMDDPHVHHDALEFSDGQIVKVTRLIAGQTARVLQLPVATPHVEHHHEESVRFARVSESRLALDRVSMKPGLASILMPSQGAVMLWQSCRSAAARLPVALQQAFRRFKAHKQRTVLTTILPAGSGAFQIEQSFGVAVTSPKMPLTTDRRVKVKTGDLSGLRT